jgi:hypothetical protein
MVCVQFRTGCDRGSAPARFDEATETQRHGAERVARRFAAARRHALAGRCDALVSVRALRISVTL